MSTLRMIGITILLTAFAQPIIVQASVLNDLAERDTVLWAPAALRCAVELPRESQSVYMNCPQEKKACFPGEGRESPSGAICGDGDMTLFNSLLCLANYEEGCLAVSAAQNQTTGQWYRSPRLAEFPRLRTSNTFSGDMALGVLLWAALAPKTRSEQLSWWIDWIGRNQRCVSKGCQLRHPRFCPDDDIDGDQEARNGCALKPGDLATLALVTKKLKITVTDRNFRKELSRWEPMALDLLVANALGNDVGYSQHLVGINILVLWKIGISHPSLNSAASHLAKVQPQNAFFAWLAGKPSTEVASLALAKCPATPAQIPPPTSREDWIWQREDSSAASSKSMLWDCRFIAGLVANGLSTEGPSK